MNPLTRNTAVAATLGALLMGGALAQGTSPTPAPLPPVQQSGAVQYLSGGIGLDESTAIKKASQQWPLTLEFAVKDQQHAVFAADVDVLVRDASGRAALQATSDGPFLLARLQPGHYSVAATLAGKTLHENVVIRKGQPARAVFVWPAGVETAHS